MKSCNLPTVFAAIQWTFAVFAEAQMVLQRFTLLSDHRGLEPTDVVNGITHIETCVKECTKRYSPCRGVSYKSDEYLCEMLGPERSTISMNSTTGWAFFYAAPKRGENLRVGATASQSSDNLMGWDAGAGKAIDGSTITNFNIHPGCATTGDQANPWWMVDFHAQHTIVGILLWNRADCCPWRLLNLIITISPTLAAIDDVTANQCTTYPGPGTFEENPIMMMCERHMEGRLLKILAAASTYLTVCEVEFLIR